MKFSSTLLFVPALAMALALPALAAPTTFVIDPVHSGAKFEIEHLLVSSVSGQFTRFQGNILLDAANPANSSVDVTIDASSITTQSEARDKHLSSPAFFDVAKFPTITFKSTSVAPAANGLSVTGTFTMHGVTKTVVIPVTQKGPFPGMKPGTQVIGFKGALKLKRSDYGMTTMIGPVGDEVDVTLNVEANAAPAAN